MKKPPLQSVPSGISDGVARLLGGMKERLELISGERGDALDLDAVEDLTISNPPTQAEVEEIRSMLVSLIRLLQK